MVQKQRVNAYIVWNNVLVAKYDAGEARQYINSVALEIVGDHAVIHRCSKAFAHMRVGEPGVLCEKKLANTVVGKSPPWEEWREYPGFTLEEGWHYCTTDLEEVRDEYLRQGYVPRQSLSDFTKIRKLTIGKTVTQEVPEGGITSSSLRTLSACPGRAKGYPVSARNPSSTS